MLYTANLALGKADNLDGVDKHKSTDLYTANMYYQLTIYGYLCTPNNGQRTFSKMTVSCTK